MQATPFGEATRCPSVTELFWGHEKNRPKGILRPVHVTVTVLENLRLEPSSRSVCLRNATLTHAGWHFSEVLLPFNGASDASETSDDSKREQLPVTCRLSRKQVLPQSVTNRCYHKRPLSERQLPIRRSVEVDVLQFQAWPGAHPRWEPVE